MKRIVISFCGNRDTECTQELKMRLKQTLLNLLEQYNDCFISFYCGGYGNFDRLASETVDEVKTERCEKVLITPYIDVDKDTAARFDGVIYPPLETVPKRVAIPRRNDWIVNNCDVLIAHVPITFSGAKRMLDFAERRERLHGLPKIINV